MPPVSKTPAVPMAKFTTGVLIPVTNLPPVQLTFEYLCNFLKNFVMTLMLFSGAWGKMIHEKIQKQKIS
jgi:hypothetical protein